MATINDLIRGANRSLVATVKWHKDGNSFVAATIDGKHVVINRFTHKVKIDNGEWFGFVGITSLSGLKAAVIRKINSDD